MRTYVINPDQTKNFKRSVVHFFNIGQYDILILIYGSIDKKELVFGDVLNVVCFDAPWVWGFYKEASEQVKFDNGSILTLAYSSKAPSNL